MKKKTNIKNSKLPFVFSNFAITADGKIAFANGEFAPFGSKRDHVHMMELRATADAVMAGARTVGAPGVTMSPGGRKFQRLRVSRGLAEYNLRVIVTGNGSMNTRAEIFKHCFSPIIVLASGLISDKKFRELQSVADEVKVFGNKEIDLRAALRWLREKWKVKRLLCEGGGGLHGTMIRAGLVDELHLTICPVIFGGRRAPTIAEGGNLIKLADAARFKFTSAKRERDELYVVLKATKNAQS
ncbi:MAG TPA: RibD family protein [Pseudomonadales bacterium]|nr:RibD family protein [Pseudomonadales bacterium]